jgi:hypothetical protein
MFKILVQLPYDPIFRIYRGGSARQKGAQIRCKQTQIGLKLQFQRKK